MQAVYAYLATGEYSDKIAAIMTQRADLEKLLKDEVRTHTRIWNNRVAIYGDLFADVQMIDMKLRTLLGRANGKTLKPIAGQRLLGPAFTAPDNIEQ